MESNYFFDFERPNINRIKEISNKAIFIKIVKTTFHNMPIVVTPGASGVKKSEEKRPTKK